MAFVDRKQLAFEIVSQSNTVRDVAKRYAREKMFYPSVDEMRAEFESHPVTIEIDEGVDADNYSNTLVGYYKNDFGKNLFSFIGFKAGSKPTQPIRGALSRFNSYGPKLKYVRANVRRFRYEFVVYAPDLDSIYGETPMPWADGISWAKRIEQGISGIKQFVNRENLKNSRSGGGIQAKKANFKARGFRPVSYLSRISSNFISKFGTRTIN